MTRRARSTSTTRAAPIADGLARSAGAKTMYCTDTLMWEVEGAFDALHAFDTTYNVATTGTFSN